MNHEIGRQRRKFKDKIGAVQIEKRRLDGCRAGLRPTARGNDVETRLVGQPPADSCAEISKTADDDDAHHESGK
jgi:hypothetical protein